jgi:biopolymer transport protein ExbB
MEMQAKGRRKFEMGAETSNHQRQKSRPSLKAVITALALVLMTGLSAAQQAAPQSPPSATSPSATPAVATPAAPAVPAASGAPVTPSVPAAPISPAASETPATSPAAADAVTPAVQPGAPGDTPPAVAEQPPSSNTVSVGSAHLPRDLSPWGMFVGADVVVKAIMIGLMFASLETWTVWLAKSIELAAAKRRARSGLQLLQSARSLADAERKFASANDTVARLVRTASAEVSTSDDPSSESLKERVAWLLERVEVAAGRRIGRGMGALASIGATAPFVGLLGTVWGIMNSFIGISNAHTTNLAVVAPGIAEALLATALGLFAAIPAVVIYNVFARSAAGYRMLVADAAALVMRLVSRDGERAAMPLSRAAE